MSAPAVSLGAGGRLAAYLLEGPQGRQLVVFFEDNKNDVIESQTDPFAIEGFIDRVATLKEILRRKWLLELAA